MNCVHLKCVPFSPASSRLSPLGVCCRLSLTTFSHLPSFYYYFVAQTKGFAVSISLASAFDKFPRNAHLTNLPTLRRWETETALVQSCAEYNRTKLQLRSQQLREMAPHFYRAIYSTQISKKSKSNFIVYGTFQLLMKANCRQRPPTSVGPSSAEAKSGQLVIMRC